jgi:hypothetical protein
MLGRRLFPASRSVRALSTFERVRVSSIPAINEAVSSNVKSPTYLIEHPYPLDGYREKPHVTPVEQSVFAIVDHSGTQYKVVEVSALGIAFSGRSTEFLGLQDDLITTDIMHGYEPGQTVILDKVSRASCAGMFVLCNHCAFACRCFWWARKLRQFWGSRSLLGRQLQRWWKRW